MHKHAYTLKSNKKINDLHWIRQYCIIYMMQPKEEQKKLTLEEKKNSFWDFFKFTIMAVVIVFLFRTWVAQPFIVSGSSMDPTFQNGDYLIVDEISYKFHEPEKGDVIIFRYPRDPSKFFIKRVAYLPGETVEMNGEKRILGKNEYYVLGDNSLQSSDSRYWGTLSGDLIVGRAFLRLFPVNKIGIFPGNNY
jgi:signal peptidase I